MTIYYICSHQILIPCSTVSTENLWKLRFLEKPNLWFTLLGCSFNLKIAYLKYATPFEELLLPLIYTLPPIPYLRLLPAWCKYVRSVHLPWWLLNWLAQYSSIFLLKAIENSLIIQYLSFFLVNAIPPRFLWRPILWDFRKKVLDLK